MEFLIWDLVTLTQNGQTLKVDRNVMLLFMSFLFVLQGSGGCSRTLSPPAIGALGTTTGSGRRGELTPTRLLKPKTEKSL